MRAVAHVRLVATALTAWLLWEAARAERVSDSWLPPAVPAGWLAPIALACVAAVAAVGWLLDATAASERHQTERLRRRLDRAREERDAWRRQALNVSGTMHEWWTEALRQRDLAAHYEAAASRWRQSAHRLAGTDRLTTGQTWALSPTPTLEQPNPAAAADEPPPAEGRHMVTESADG